MFTFYRLVLGIRLTCGMILFIFNFLSCSGSFMTFFFLSECKLSTAPQQYFFFPKFGLFELLYGFKTFTGYFNDS